VSEKQITKPAPLEFTHARIRQDKGTRATAWHSLLIPPSPVEESSLHLETCKYTVLDINSLDKVNTVLIDFIDLEFDTPKGSCTPSEPGPSWLSRTRRTSPLTTTSAAAYNPVTYELSSSSDTLFVEPKPVSALIELKKIKTSGVTGLQHVQGPVISAATPDRVQSLDSMVPGIYPVLTDRFVQLYEGPNTKLLACGAAADIWLYVFLAQICIFKALISLHKSL
jgi:hypothetical protein